MARRGVWGSNVGFILAAVGGAVGLGNLWGFAYSASQGNDLTTPMPQYGFAGLAPSRRQPVVDLDPAHQYRRWWFGDSNEEKEDYDESNEKGINNDESCDCDNNDKEEKEEGGRRGRGRRRRPCNEKATSDDKEEGGDDDEE